MATQQQQQQQPTDIFADLKEKPTFIPLDDSPFHNDIDEMSDPLAILIKAEEENEFIFHNERSNTK